VPDEAEQPGVPQRRKKRKKARERVPRKLWALLIVLGALALVVPTLLRIFVIEAFKIPAGSMYPSLLIGDHIFVAKWGYGCEGCVPERGRVFAFRYPGLEPVDYVKRVIALPGDELEVVSGALVLNGWKVPRCHLGRTEVQEPEGRSHTYEVVVEFLQGNSYLVALDVDHDDGHQGPYRVAANEAWVLGDNRNNSSDSRAWRAGQGAGVPFGNFHGPIWTLWFPPERIGVLTEGAPSLPAELQSLAPALAVCLARAPSLADSTPPRR
jgi:signal peptidase I